MKGLNNYVTVEIIHITRSLSTLFPPFGSSEKDELVGTSFINIYYDTLPS